MEEELWPVAEVLRLDELLPVDVLLGAEAVPLEPEAAPLEPEAEPLDEAPAVWRPVEVLRLDELPEAVLLEPEAVPLDEAPAE